MVNSGRRGGGVGERGVKTGGSRGGESEEKGK